MSQHESGVGKDARVVLRDLERMPSKFDGLVPGSLRLFGPAVSDDRHVADRRQGQRRAVMPIDRDRLLEQSQGFKDPLFCYWKEGCERAQVEIVGGKVDRLSRGG